MLWWNLCLKQFEIALLVHQIVKHQLKNRYLKYMMWVYCIWILVGWTWRCQNNTMTLLEVYMTMLTVLCYGRDLIMKIKNHQNLITLKTSSRGVKTLAPVENCFTQTLRIYLLLLFCIVLFGNTGSGLHVFFLFFVFNKKNFYKKMSLKNPKTLRKC